VLERKMRLLVLSALAFEHVGRDVPYSAIASALHVPAGDVEAWAIDAIRAGLVGGKLSQAAGALRVARAQPRTFGPPQWAALEQRLLAWQAGLAGVLDVVLQAQKAGGRPGAPPGAAQDGAKGAQEPAQPA
jgi:translation initiation factor 3 subunit M